MTKSEYQELTLLTNHLIRKYSKPLLIAEEVINAAYVLLYEKQIDNNFQTLKKVIAKTILSYENESCLPLESVGQKRLKYIQDYKFCSGCLENGPQPLSAFPIRKIFPNGKITVRPLCIKCQGKKSTAYYQRLKKENPSKYNEVLKKARDRMNTNYGIIKKNPLAHKIFRSKQNENNRAYKNRKKEEKLKTGWRPHDSSRSPVIARNLKGTIIARFCSVKEAAEAIKRNRVTLSRAMKKKSPCAGFYFEYTKPVNSSKKPKIVKVKSDASNAKAVIARDRKGRFVARFASITEAANSIKRSRPNILRSIRRKWACGGYYFEKEQNFPL